MTGVGQGLHSLPPILITQFYFKKYRALASGFSLMGHSSGTFIFMPVLRKLIESFGWRYAMTLQSGFVLQVLVFGSMYRPVDKHEETPDGEDGENEQKKSCFHNVLQFIKSTWDWKLLKNVQYVLYLISVLLSFYVIEIVYKLTPFKSTVDGLSLVEASYLPACIGVVSTVTRFFVSFLANFKCVNRIYILVAAMLIECIGCTLLAFASSFPQFAAICAFTGVGIGKTPIQLTT